MLELVCVGRWQSPMHAIEQAHLFEKQTQFIYILFLKSDIKSPLLVFGTKVADRPTARHKCANMQKGASHFTFRLLPLSLPVAQSVWH